MNFSAFLIITFVAIACLIFGYSEGKRVNPQHKELTIRTLFEISLVQQQLELLGKYEDVSEVEKLQIAAALAGTKLQIFRKQYAKHEKDNTCGKEEA